MNKESLLHYGELIDEIEDTKAHIAKIKGDIKRIENQISDIESGGMVKDKVYGGEGGWQGFVIEGVPIPEYNKLKIVLGNRKICLSHEIDELCNRATMLDNERVQVQRCITGIKDPQLRRIVHFRFIKRLKWHEVAKSMGQGYTEEAVKQAFSRFLRREVK